jgi:tRNA A-37 threonylcarbamoyl transferase component Bud32
VGIRLLLDKMLAPALAAAGIASAPAIFRLGGDPEATSVVTTVDLPVDGTVGRFHLKRYRYAGWPKAKGLLGRGTGWGTAPEVQEFKNLAFLREKGVPAVRPVAAASETKGMLLVAHALLTEDLPGAIDLEKRLAAPGDPVRDDPKTRRRVMELIGRHVHRMHGEGFTHRDLFARNVLVRVEEGDPSVAFCDCRRGGSPTMNAKALLDLATLDADLVGRVPVRDRLRGLRSYAGGEGSLRSWAKEIDALRAKEIARRERKKGSR